MHRLFVATNALDEANLNTGPSTTFWPIVCVSSHLNQ